MITWQKVGFFYVLLMSLGLMFSCGNPENKTANPETPIVPLPKKLLPEQKFVSILADFHMVEAVVSQLGVRDSLSKIQRFERYEYNVFRRQGVDSTTYHANYRYYMSHNDKAKELLKALLDTLKMREKKGVLE
ncbi:MAG: DUF4296 domain-containing protein [Cytophagales bacterium]|nr:MAG: DUF4296 domain-containing protein [Cytophagales bacterium]TAF62115.1 MAG: DUF4296 domain-containing protein [Cytophagales bacterium]